MLLLSNVGGGAAAAGLFGAPAAYATGSHAHGVAVGDLDGDGHADLVVANAGADTVSLLRGDGAGAFGPPLSLAVGAAPKMAAIGDLNGDGRADIVSANQDADTVSVLLAQPGGGYAARADYAACSHPHEVAIGRLNGDAAPDLAVACWGGSVVSVLLGAGGGTFGAAAAFGAGSGPHSVVIRDFNGDGAADLAVANNYSADVSVLLGSGDGTFAAAVNYATGTGPHAIRAADLNGDGRPDLAEVNDGSDTVGVLLGHGDGTFAAAVGYAAGSVPKGVAIGDVDGDGAPDLVATDTAGSYPTCCHPGGAQVSVLLGRGDGTFGAPAVYPVGQTPFGVALGDFNGDGRPDVATANWDGGGTTVLLNQLPPLASPSPSPSPSPTPTPSPTPSASPSPSPVPGMPVVTVSGPGAVEAGAGGALTARPAAGAVFVGWAVDGQAAGWAGTLTPPAGAATVGATFAPRQAFADAGPSQTGATEAIAQLAARGIVKGCDPAANRFCPTDPTLRAQMAVLIVRALGWGGENPPNPFPDRNGVDDELWRAVAILADHGVARGYGDGTYGTTAPVLNAQVISFITRAMVDKGYWAMQPDDGTAYPNVPAASGHRQDLVTYIHYAGAVRGAADTTANFAGWDQPSSRAYFAFALWQALDSYFGPAPR